MLDVSVQGAVCMAASLGPFGDRGDMLRGDTELLRGPTMVNISMAMVMAKVIQDPLASRHTGPHVRRAAVYMARPWLHIGWGATKERESATEERHHGARLYAWASVGSPQDDQVLPARHAALVGPRRG